MGRKKKYIENLTEEEKAALKRGHKYGKQFQFRNRCECILLSHEKHDVSSLSKRFKAIPLTIYSWLRSWEASGIEGLKNKPGQGRKPKLDKENKTQVAKVKELVENEPQNLNKVVGQIQETLYVDLSKKTLIRFLKNLNISGSDFEKSQKISQMKPFIKEKKNNSLS